MAAPFAVYTFEGLATDDGYASAPVNLSKGYAPVKCRNGETIREDRLKKNAEVAAISDPYDPHHAIAAWVGGQGIISSVSFNGGQSWSNPSPLPLTACLNENLEDFKGGADEWITIGADKTVYVSALVGYRRVDRQALLVDTSKDGGLTWQDPVVVPTDPKLNSDVDNTSIVADSGNPGLAYVATESIHDETTSSVGFSRTTDGGKSWSPMREVVKLTKGRRFPGPQLLFESSSKRLYAFSKVQESGKSWIARIYSEDQGVSWSAPTRIAECIRLQSETKLGAAEIAFESAQDILHVAEDEKSGSVYLVFNDARATNGSHLGVSLVSSLDRGRSWTQPIAVNGPSAGHAFQPAVAVNSKHEIGMSYYDTRSTFPEQPGKTLPVAVWRTIIGSGGKRSELRLDQFNYLGLERRGLLDYQALIVIDGRFHAVYTKTNLKADEARPIGAEENVTDIFFQ
jgi:hypothetical protein